MVVDSLISAAKLLSCVASVSSRGSSRKLGQEQKKKKDFFFLLPL